MSCPAGQACLRDLVPSNYHVADLCVPSCDSELNCPPNYSCWRRVSGPAAPNVCVPGLQSARCFTSLDCMIGDCLDTGEGFRLCSIPCQRDSDCLPYFDPSNPLVCVAAGSGGQRHCVAPTSFSGVPCLHDGDCPGPQRCFFSTPYERGNLGQCRPACGQDDHCAPRGGIAHTCFVQGAERSCYPGRFGLPCRQAEDCIAGFACQSSICTIPCTSDADCDANPWTTRSGYCEASLCRLAAGHGGSCQRDAQCRGTLRCKVSDGGAAGACADP
jgi:hypothetical protein